MNIIVACFVLHRMCELNNQEIFEEWQQNIDIDVSENMLYSGIYSGFESGWKSSEKKRSYMATTLL